MNTSSIRQFLVAIKKILNNVYYQSQESIFGQHKRDIVIIKVDNTCHSLMTTKEQFESALEQFKKIVSVEQTSLEQRYKTLKRQFEFCKIRADNLKHRIASIEQVSASLFKEWEDELDSYNNRTLRSRSLQQLKTAKKQYVILLKVLYKAENKIHPVLAGFKDQVLFFKHNLNAQAIAALQYEFVEVSIDISQLIKIMEITLNEASQFVSTLTNKKSLPSA